MPELPEVETTCRGIAPHVTGQKIRLIELRETRLRWPVSPEIEDLVGSRIKSVSRRAKYLLLGFDSGTLLIHLGMSGSLRVIDPAADLRKHDHVLISLENGMQLRFHDPRRFGCMLWTDENSEDHELIKKLGPEPLSDDFNVEYLAATLASRKTTIKQAIMDGKVVVGVGNIYACEALYKSGIYPGRIASEVKRPRLKKLVDEIKAVLSFAIEEGGTTLKDFLREDGTAGYFKQKLNVYDREGKVCRSCEGLIEKVVLGQRSTFYCPKCQK